MSPRVLDKVVAEATDVFAAQLRARLSAEPGLAEVDGAALGAQAASWAAAAIDAGGGGSPLARRIGPVYRVEQLRRWLLPPGAEPLTDEAVRKRVKLRQLVAFRTDDRQWALPAWQFDPVAGRLVPRDQVIALWRRLSTGGLFTDADLAAWMNTRFGALGTTPAEYAHRHGADAAPLAAAVGRLAARAS